MVAFPRKGGGNLAWLHSLETLLFARGATIRGAGCSGCVVPCRRRACASPGASSTHPGVRLVHAARDQPLLAERARLSYVYGCAFTLAPWTACALQRGCVCRQPIARRPPSSLKRVRRAAMPRVTPWQVRPFLKAHARQEDFYFPLARSRKPPARLVLRLAACARPDVLLLPWHLQPRSRATAHPAAVVDGLPPPRWLSHEARAVLPWSIV